MSDSIGATTVPLVVPATGFALTDPLLTYFLQYLQAVANKHGFAAWQSIHPSTVPVKTIFANDPREEDFNEKDLPALFAWRDSQNERADFAIDIEVVSGNINLLWVPPTIQQDRRRLRRPFVKGLFDLFDVYFERGRDPAWYIPGDTYPQNTGDAVTNAANCKALGSVLFHYMKFRRMWINKWQSTKVSVQIEDAKPRTYEAYMAVCPYEEQLAIDNSRWAELDSVDVTISVPAQDPLPETTIVEGIAT